MSARDSRPPGERPRLPTEIEDLRAELSSTGERTLEQNRALGRYYSAATLLARWAARHAEAHPQESPSFEVLLIRPDLGGKPAEYRAACTVYRFYADETCELLFMTAGGGADPCRAAVEAIDAAKREELARHASEDLGRLGAALVGINRT